MQHVRVVVSKIIKTEIVIGVPERFVPLVPEEEERCDATAISIAKQLLEDKVIEFAEYGNVDFEFDCVGYNSSPNEHTYSVQIRKVQHGRND